MSEVLVRCTDGQVIADGWINFVQGGGDLPLFVFWLFLDLIDDEGRSVDAKEECSIPPHVWGKLPLASKNACTNTDRYDARWKNDPNVEAWRRALG